MTVTNTTPTLKSVAVTPDYNTLKRLIEQLQASGPAEQVLPLLVQILGHPKLLSTMLCNIANDTQWLAKVQQSSYYHRNGFDKLVLMEGEHFKLRLHHFRPFDNLLPAENIHDHRWPFASAIVSGRLCMHIYEPHPNGGIPVQAYRYHSAKTNGRYHCEPMGNCGLVQTDSLNYDAGTYYFMPTTTLHQIVQQPGDEVLTLMLTGKPERTTCRLFAKGILENEEDELIPYTKQQLANKIRTLAKHIITQPNTSTK